MPRRKRQSGRRPWTYGRVSYHQKELGLTKCGDMVVGSKAVVIARLTGTEPIGVGGPGDGLQGLEMTAAYLNEFFGTPPDAKVTAGGGAGGVAIRCDARSGD